MDTSWIMSPLKYVAASPMKLVNRLTGRNAESPDRKAAAAKPSAAQRLAAKVLKPKPGSSAIGKDSKEAAANIKIEPVPEEKDDRYMPVLAPSPKTSPSKVVIKTEKLEMTMEEDGSVCIRNSPEKDSKSKKRLAAAEIRGGSRAKAPAKKAKASLSKAIGKAGKGVVVTSHTQIRGDRKSLRSRKHNSGFYSEKNQRALKWCKGKGTTKSPYVID